MAENVNKIFNGSVIPLESVVSQVRVNREYLLSNYVADELNTYRTWNIFPVANDAYAKEYDADGNEILTGNNGPGAPGVRSIFNKSGAVMLGGSNGGGYDVINDSSEWRISNNVPLMDSPDVRQRIRKNSGCTVKELVEASENGFLGRETYSYSDFMYCKYLGKVPNNYMITLRRFPLPVSDFISSVGEGYSRSESRLQAQDTTSIGCMVTWMGTPGNDMSNILKYSYKMPFKFINSQWNQVSGADYDSQQGPLNAIAAAFDPTYRKHYQSGHTGTIFNKYIGKHFKAGDQPYSVQAMQEHYDRSKVYGPVDTIKGTYMRDEGGLEFNQTLSLQFDYELRAYNGINPRQAMLDLLSNILNVTYTTGTFWGGGYTGYGSGQSNLFTNLEIFKANGGFTSFVDAFSKDYSTVTSAIGKKFNVDFKGNILSMLKSAMNQLGGMILGGMLNNLGRPAKVYANSLLSPAPVGFWHVTIGNPHHPIMSMGNMIVTNTTIEHYGPLGLDDFPTGLRVTVELERGKPRDIREIEKLYMHGNDRIYSSMGAEIERMYKCSKEYKGANDQNKNTLSSDIKESTNEKRGAQFGALAYNKPSFISLAADKQKQNTGEITLTKYRDMKNVWKKYFGVSDVENIMIAAMEQENGSQKKKSKTASGNSGKGTYK